MPDVEVLGILKIMHEVVGDQPVHRKFDPQKINASNSSSCKTHTQTRSSNQIMQMELLIIQACQTNSNPV